MLKILHKVTENISSYLQVITIDYINVPDKNLCHQEQSFLGQEA